MKRKVLIIDDEEIIRLSLGEGLKDLGYTVATASNGKEALENIRNSTPSIVLLDIRLEYENGLDILPEIKNFDKDIEVVIMTAYADISSAVKAMKLGAYDYINKPFDLEEIDIIIKRIRDKIDLQNKILIMEKSKRDNIHIDNIVGKHPLLQEIFNKIELLAQNDDVTVLIRGETGTGKDVVASAIHNNSIRKDKELLKINCGSIPEHLMESEFFGFEKNAFTGANSRKKGLMEIADGGTVFLDEIGELPMNMQAKLLTFIEDKKFKRVGGLEDIKVDIRIIAATNKNLEEAIENKEFREDLYYRLNVIPVYLPPLRERGEDILLLANKFLEEYNIKYKKSILGFTKDMEEKLLNYEWRGNVRELRNILERAVLLIDRGYIAPIDLPLLESTYGEDSKQIHEHKLFEIDFSLEDEINNIERKYIELALEKSDNNYTKAAEILGLSRYALRRRTEKYF